MAPRARKKQARGEERKRQIIEVARRLFVERGFEATSMASVAAEVGVVEGAIYKHFGSKRDLLSAVLEEFYEGLIADLREGLRGITGARNRLRFVIWRQLCTLTETADLCRLIMRWVRPFEDYEGSIVHRMNRDLTRFSIEVYEEGIAAGAFRRVLPSVMFRDVVYGSIEHIAWRVVNGKSRELDVDAVADQLTELLCNGLGSSEGREASIAGEVERLSAQIDRLERLG